MSFSPADQGSNDDVDTDANVSTGRTISTTLSAGETDPSLDAGLYTVQTDKVAIGNTVWSDSDNNGKMDTGEPGLAGITVELWPSPGSTPLMTVTTDASGNYLFPNITPGKYFVAVAPPSGYNSSSGSASDPVAGDQSQAGGDDGSPNSSVHRVTSRVFTTTVGSGPTGEQGNPTNLPDNNAYMTIDFGFTSSPNMVSVRSIRAERQLLPWAFALLILGSLGLAAFRWRRRRAL
jgi:hypothetical protein